MVKDFNLPKWKWEASGKTFEERKQVVKFGMALILTFLEMTKKSKPIEKNPQFLEFQFEIKNVSSPYIRSKHIKISGKLVNSNYPI